MFGFKIMKEIMLFLPKRMTQRILQKGLHVYAIQIMVSSADSFSNDIAKVEDELLIINDLEFL